LDVEGKAGGTEKENLKERLDGVEVMGFGKRGRLGGKKKVWVGGFEGDWCILSEPGQNVVNQNTPKITPKTNKKTPSCVG